MAFSYYASKISDNIGKTPEGFLICQDAVIARTGWQTYTIGELPADALKELDIDTSDPSASIDVYRSPEEVFSPATIASFEGKSVTDNHPPAEQFVNPDTITQYELGHVQNVRKGKAPLESGEWPLLGDIFIKREPLLGKVKADQVRELSCGYDYTLARDGDRIVQTEIRGNHVAVVPRGRAGAEARIKDSAPEASERNTAGGGSTGNQKEKPKVPNMLKHLLGLGLKAFAADADPEKLAEAAEAIREEKKAEVPPPEKKADDRRADEKRADDRRADEKKADDCKTDDKRVGDKRARFHAMLDRMLDESEKGDEDEHTEDADMDELRELLGEFLEEGEGEYPERAGEPGAEGAEGEEVPARDSDPDDVALAGSFYGGKFHPYRDSDHYSAAKAGEGKKKRRAHDRLIEPVTDEHAAADHEPTARDVLQALRPVVARSNDAGLRRAFNAQLGRFTRSSRASSGSYAGFSGATRQRAADESSQHQPEHNQKLQTAYDAIRTGKPISKEEK
jgi:hypothetical protein